MMANDWEAARTRQRREAKSAFTIRKLANRSGLGQWKSEVGGRKTEDGEEKDGDTRTFDFKVEKYWKGADAERVEILVYETARYQAWFKKSGKYLIYATADEDGKLRVGRCSRSRDLENAEEDLQKLGKGKVPR